MLQGLSEYWRGSKIVGVSIRKDDVYIHNKELVQLLRTVINDKNLYYLEDYAKLELSSCVSQLPQMRKHDITLNSQLLKDFILTIEQAASLLLGSSKAMIEDKKISYDNICLLFSVGMEVYFTLDDIPVAGIIYYVQRRYTPTDKYEIKINIIKKIGNTIYYEQIEHLIEEFKDLRSIDTLPIKLLDSKMKDSLQKRGEKCIKYLNEKFSYVHYDGIAIRNKHPYDNIESIHTQGRVIIDHENYNKEMRGYYGYDVNSRKKCVLKASEYFMLYPYLPGYDISRQKTWMEFFIDNITQIKFNENIFDLLSLSPIYKEMIMAAIKNKKSYVKDIVLNKGNGLIFLLHGPPGVGKTLTAETTAEYLREPLYYVNIGELGTDVEKLELRLDAIMKLAERWNAVLLLDEADVFLEARDCLNIERNAMVGIFLRLLEYYSGIIFLTSNRVKILDKAVKSRIHLSLKYDKLLIEQKLDIWRIVIKQLSDITADIDTKTLCNYDLNGRQIRTVINLAQSLSKSREVLLCTEIITSVIKNFINTEKVCKKKSSK